MTIRADTRAIAPLSQVAPPGPDKEGPSPAYGRWQDLIFPLLGTGDQPPCDFGPDGLVWICHYDIVLSSDQQCLRGYCPHDVSWSGDVACPAAADYLVSTTRYEDAALFVCAGHEAWLWEHGFINNMTSGRCASRIDGAWETHLAWVWDLPEARGLARPR